MNPRTDDHYVDMDGNPISFQEWVALTCVDKAHRVIAESTLPGGRILKTVWCGTEFPLIGVRAFGTAIMSANGTFIVEIGQYSAPDIALRCHAIHFTQISRSTRELQLDHTQDPEFG